MAISDISVFMIVRNIRVDRLVRVQVWYDGTESIIFELELLQIISCQKDISRIEMIMADIRRMKRQQPQGALQPVYKKLSYTSKADVEKVTRKKLH